MDWQLAAQNLISPPVLFFALGVAAALMRSDLSIPEAIAKGLSLYLMLSIGFKGGVAAGAHGLGFDLIAVIAAAVVLSFLIPFIAFGFLKLTTALPQVDMAAISAHYGSISIVTFIAAISAIEAAGLTYPGIMVAAAAAMEVPAIATALFLARSRAEGPVQGETPWREAALNGSVLLLVGAFIVGLITGEQGYEDVAPFIVAPFTGVLCLFLLDMGLVAGGELRQARKNLTPALLGFGLYMPPIGGLLGGAAGALIGMDTGGVALLTVLAASASYIAVPAAMRLALPEARPSLYLTLSLAITFPFNLTIGIPLYIAYADWLT